MRARIGLAALLLLCLLPGLASAEGGALYEIFPSSFYDADGDRRGDLRGVLQKLDYLEDLGVSGLWLTPIHPSPSYHGYDVTDYLAVDPALGTVGDVAALADALHERGMLLVLDLVLNHTSSGHPWFTGAVKALAAGDVQNPHIAYYHFSGKPTPGWHGVPDVPGFWYEGWFSPDMPDLNLDSEAVRAEILDICRFWLGAGVDGFRLDAVLAYYGEDTVKNTAFLSWLMESLRAMKPDIYVVGEAWKDAGTIERYYGSSLPSLFNFPFAGPEGAIVNAIRGGDGAALAQRAADWQAVWAAHPGATDAPFLSNHDIARIAGALMQKPGALKLAASLYLTLPGTPFLYYGEEIGMTGSGRDENKRLPMLWSDGDATGACLPPQGADQTAKAQGSVQGQLADPDSLLNHYRALLRLRNAHLALQTGTLSPLNTGVPSLCAYALESGSETLYVLHNLGKEAVTLPWTHAPIAWLNAGEGAAYDGAALTLPPMASVVAQ